MSSSSSSIFFFFFSSFFLLSTAADDAELYHICNNNGNYSTNSTYQSNLKQLFSTLAANGSRTGFLNDSIGQIPDQVYGLVLCRGDTNASACDSCLLTANQDVLQDCAYDKGAIIWYDRCLLQFSNQRSILSSTGNGAELIMFNSDNVTDVGRFNRTVNELLNSITSWTAFNTTKKFATGEVNFTVEFPTIYGLVQCTPDLTGSQCQQCLQPLFEPLPTQIVGKKGGRVLGARCNFRFEVYKFYDGVSTAPPLPPQGSNTTAPPPPRPAGTAPAREAEGKKKNQTGKILAITIPVVSAVLMISVLSICFLWRKRARKNPYENNPEEITSVDSLLFNLSDILVATANFAEENKLGEGGFGAVYKGLLPDGRVIAVKKLLRDSGEGLGELKNELVLVAKLQHRNLVQLLGVCFEEEKLLVYEYVPNRSLDTFLFDPERSELLNWRIRYKIISGVARGLLYLHEESQLRIIHRDLKASNVLLDADMNPKISDFGLARLFGGDQTQGITSRVVGTFGYMAPEYVLRGQFSVKSDIFSFGILVLEIITGRKNSGSLNSENDEDLLSFTWERWTRGAISEILDPSLGENCPISEVMRCIHIGLLCVQENPSDRPNMSRISLMLNSNSVSLRSPSHPAFLVGKSNIKSISYSSSSDLHGATNGQSSSQSTLLSTNDVTISELDPR